MFPPIWLVVLLIAISTILLVAVFMNGWEQQVIAYFVYVLAFYTLTVATLFCVMVLPQKCSILKQKVYSNSFGNRYFTDQAFRTKIHLYLSLCINLLYVGINILFWHFSHSWWFVVLAVYYVIMAVMRFLLVRYVQQKVIGSNILDEWKRSRLCAYILLLINFSLSGAVLMILYQDRGYDYPGMMIYVMALYSFYATTHAVINIVKHRKAGSPILSTANIVSLSAALVSMLNLETAMFAQFGAEMTQENQSLMVILTGAGISITIITLSIILIAKSTSNIRSKHHGK